MKQKIQNKLLQYIFHMNIKKIEVENMRSPSRMQINGT
jgi:hypothetical protein